MKQKIPVICNIISIILLAEFVIKTLMDYARYSPAESSAPFSAWILANAILFVLPAVVVFLIGPVVKKKRQ
jgi:hypothetical protein